MEFDYKYCTIEVEYDKDLKLFKARTTNIEHEIVCAAHSLTDLEYLLHRAIDGYLKTHHGPIINISAA